MQHKVKFKGKNADGTYHWENLVDSSPKQLFSIKNDIVAKAFPKVNQQYIVRYGRLNGAEMVEPYEVIEFYASCGYWNVVGAELVFKKGKNKGLTVTQYTSSFPYNPDEEKSFVKSLTALYRKSNNVYTRGNIIKIFNSGAIRYCEVFGYKGDTILIGSYKGTNITEVPRTGYIRVRNRLEYFKTNIINPQTHTNCDKWILLLDHKYAKH